MKLLILTLYRFQFLCLTGLFSCLPTVVFTQTGLYTSFSAGVDVSYNRLLSDRPLPPDPVALKRAGPCFDFGLNYRFHPRFSIDVHTKAASIKRGFIVKDSYVMERDSATGTVISERTGVPVFSNRSLFHLHAGASVYPVVKPKLEWKIGAGVAPIRTPYIFRQPVGIRLDGEDKLFSAVFEENRLRKIGWLININTSLAYKVSERGALILTLNHNQGLKDILEQRSISYFYLDKRTNTRDEYNARLLNNGSYSSCTIGYSYKLFSTPIDNSRYTAGQKGIYASLNAGVNISYNRLVSDTPLPDDPAALTRAGFCRDLGLQYRFHPRFSLDLNVKAASIKRGLAGKKGYVLDPDSTGLVNSNNGIGLDFRSSSPLHFQLGGSIYPLVRPRIEWKIGAGIAPMVLTNGYAPPLALGMDAEDLFFSAGFEEEKKLRRTGWLVNLNTSLSYKVGEKGAFVLTLNHNQSLTEVFEHQSLYYFFRDKKAGTSENYDVRLMNNASYSSCTFGYSYHLFTPGSGRRQKS